MALSEEIDQLRQQGSPDEVISQLLIRRGYAPQEITNALSASTIRDAVTAPGQGDQDLQPSLSTNTSQESPPLPSPEQPSSAQYAEQPQYQDAYQTQGYGGATGDTIAEIAEQVVSEKMARAENALNQLTLFKGTSEAQLHSLDERLKRIENIIDKLQLSLLQRVGEYLTNGEDLKRELLETQKTVKTLSSRGQIAPQSRTRQTQQSE
ncbi:hypothetical protein FJZ22_03190 [Candidatus Pacearchaeota archaeon]|nr:hypothetical protein [Candidatus Pacearchaeota archaeon]